MLAASERAKGEGLQPGAASSRVRCPRGMRAGHSQLRREVGMSESTSADGEQGGGAADGTDGCGKWSLRGSKVIGEVLSG